MGSRLPRYRYYFYFSVIGIALFYKIGSYPPSFDAFVEHAIHPEVNHVIDHQAIPGEITWLWTDMHQHGAGRSPVYACFVEFGLRCFGLSLFAVRAPQAAFALAVLFWTFFSLRKIYSAILAESLLVLMGLSAWYLILSRSGGIVGFSLTWILLSVTLVLNLYINREEIFECLSASSGRPWVRRGMAALPVGAGIAVGLLPYMYAAVRPFPIAVILLVIALYRKLSPGILFLFFGSIIAIVSYQAKDIHNALHVYFHARGESLIEMANQQTSHQTDFVIRTIKENILSETRILFGFNQRAHWLNPDLADSYWSQDVVLYPKFLAPLFLFGLLRTSWEFLRNRRLRELLPIGFFLIGLVPCLGAGLGGPNQSRNIMLLAPIYFFVAAGCESVFSVLSSRFSSEKARIALATLGIGLIGGTAAYQVINFFYQEKGLADDRNTPIHDEYRFAAAYFLKHPEARIVIHEQPIFGQYSYVMMRWLGGEEFKRLQARNQIVYLTQANQNSVRALLATDQMDLIVTASQDELYLLFPFAKKWPREIRERMTIITIHPEKNPL